jgi:hypothetical protein
MKVKEPDECAYCGHMIGQGDNPCKCVARKVTPFVRVGKADLSCDSKCSAGVGLIHLPTCRMYDVNIRVQMTEQEKAELKTKRESMRLEKEYEYLRKQGGW